MTYRTRRDAIRDARIAMWGDVHLSKRPMLMPEVDERSVTFGPYVAIGTYVTADVNGRDIVVEFDNYGRDIHVGVLPR